MKIHVEFNSVAEMASFSKFVNGGLQPHSDVKFKEKDKPAIEDPYKWKYERTVQNLERALQRISMLDPKGTTANYDFMPEAPIKGTSVDELLLTIRAQNCLKAEGIKTIEELCTKTRNYLRKLPNLGKVTLHEIIDALAKRKLKLKGEA